MITDNRRRRIGGRGIINSLIDNLPFEAHIPGDYRYCGPGTRLEERLKRKDPGINPLDEACKFHDIAYSKSTDLESRHKADRVLIDRAWERFKSSDASLGERAASYLVTNIMKAKTAMGAGLKKKKRSRARKPKKGRGVCKKGKVRRKVSSSKRRKSSGRGLKNKKGDRLSGTRIIPLPKRGGILQYLIPLLTGLSNIGSVAGTANELLKTLRSMRGKGLKKRGVLADFKKGYGLYLKPYPSQNC